MMFLNSVIVTRIMKIEITPASRETILPLRELYRAELNCQIVYDNSHVRDNCVEWHLVHLNGEVAGYGIVWIGPYGMPKGSVGEFYVRPAFRTAMFPLFEAFLAATKPPRLYAQTNDPFLGVLIYDYVAKIEVGHIIFEDKSESNLAVEGAIFRQATPADKDRIFEHKVEPVGDWLLEFEGQNVATGGIGYHYNPPYGDIFMEVHPDFRRRGFGSFLVQELKRICREADRVPCARTTPTNVASRRTLERAGFAPYARIIWGEANAKK
jgi:GNAT superfamily N-acetyltransferase